jgi:hypothetical protein
MIARPHPVISMKLLARFKFGGMLVFKVGNRPISFTVGSKFPVVNFTKHSDNPCLPLWQV